MDIPLASASRGSSSSLSSLSDGEAQRLEQQFGSEMEVDNLSRPSSPVPTGAPATPDIKSARADLEKNLDAYTLVPTFVAGDPARIAAATAMIADGTVPSNFFFHDQSHLSESDPYAGPSTSRRSVLDELVDTYSEHRPDLSAFKEGQGKPAPTPEKLLLSDVKTFHDVLGASRSGDADPEIRAAATDPSIAAKSWGMFAKRAGSLSSEHHSEAIRSMYSDGLKSVAALPPSVDRAAAAREFAGSAGLLDKDQQRDAYKTAIGLIADTPPHILDRSQSGRLLQESASSLSSLHESAIPGAANYLMGKPRGSGFHEVPAGIAQALGVNGRDVEKWHDQGRLNIEIRRKLRND